MNTDPVFSVMLVFISDSSDASVFSDNSDASEFSESSDASV